MATTIRFSDGATITVGATDEARCPVGISVVSAAGSGLAVKLTLIDAAALIATVAVAMAESHENRKEIE